MSEAEKCVCCGATIPEGRQVCIMCGYEANKPKPDLVEVVRCKDCKHCKEWGKSIWCDKHKVFMSMQLDDFCSYGERKESK